MTDYGIHPLGTSVLFMSSHYLSRLARSHHQASYLEGLLWQDASKILLVPLSPSAIQASSLFGQRYYCTIVPALPYRSHTRYECDGIEDLWTILLQLELLPTPASPPPHGTASSLHTYINIPSIMCIDLHRLTSFQNASTTIPRTYCMCNCEGIRILSTKLIEVLRNV